LPWSAEIVAEASGALRFTGTARPAADFVTNRTGFVIMHPLERVAGCPVDVTHVDGTKRRARFPDFVDPEQCFFDVRALSHEAVPGVWATCTMEGDAWEMEDHRNWLDASFKTYVRPLVLPHPYTIEGAAAHSDGEAQLLRGDAKGAKGSVSGHVALGRVGTTRMPPIGAPRCNGWMRHAPRPNLSAQPARS
jgi:hypothetical protein